MNSAERLQEWAHLDQEAPDIIDENRPAEKWPRKGKIQFDKISISYNGTDKVLKQISASIKPGERVGIVGRTGAGAQGATPAIPTCADDPLF
jgi:ABC-type multidrug transport system fused ATPase/permease subunit